MHSVSHVFVQRKQCKPSHINTMPKKKHIPLPKKWKVVSGEHAGPAKAQQANQDDPQPPVVANVQATGAPTNNHYPDSGETTTGPPIQQAYQGNLLQPVIPSEAAQVVELHMQPMQPKWTQSSHPSSTWLLLTMKAATMRILRVTRPMVDQYLEWMKNLQKFLLCKQRLQSQQHIKKCRNKKSNNIDLFSKMQNFWLVCQVGMWHKIWIFDTS
jgi:hypothetical protein